MPRNPIPPTDASSPAKRPKLRHIVDAMTTPPMDKTPTRPPTAPKIPFAPIATPTPKRFTPSKGKENATQTRIPTSIFAAPNRAWQPRCNHITMARVYHQGFLCEHCRRPGPFGWLYRCTQDREVLVQDTHDRGGLVAWDVFGAMFVRAMSLGKWGPDKRADPYALLKEMGDDADMKGYRPGQIARLLEEREKVRQKARIQPSPTPGQRPWVPFPHDECQYKICHACYRGGQDKAPLSLNGILAGDIPPTAAIGYTYQYMGMRPILDGRVVAKIGYRAVPLPRYFSTSPTSTSGSSQWSVMDIIDHHLQPSSSDEPTAPPPPPKDSRMTEYGPVWWADRTIFTDESDTSTSTDHPTGLAPPPVSHQRRAQKVLLRPPPGFAPLPNPDLVGFVAHDNRNEQTATSILGNQVFTDQDTTYHAKDNTLALVCTTPLPSSTVSEDVFMSEGRTAMEEEELEEGIFHREPLVVADGVAVTEEGVEEGRADVGVVEG